MKKSFVAIAALSFASVALALTPAEREAQIQKSIAASGGIITIVPTGNVLRVVNAQKTLPPSVFNPIMADVKKIGIDIPMEVSDATPLTGKDPIALARSSVLTKKTGAVIAIVEVKDFPTLLAAPEDAWAIVNLRNLKADKPSSEKLIERLTKEFWRALAAGVGGGNSMMGPCVMRPIASLADLDRMTAKRFGPEPPLRIISSLPAYGIDMYQRYTYEDACEEGVAPAPTNAVQQAIWDKVHALPTKPITIKPETKPVKE